MTPSTAAINRAIEYIYRSGGGELNFEGLNLAVNVAGQDRWSKNYAVKLRPRVSLRGNGARLKLVSGNASLIGTTDDPWSHTVARIVGNVTAGDTVFAVDSSAGFAKGRQVLLRGADSPLDVVESLTNMLATVVSVGVGTIELDRAAPNSFVAGSVVGADNGRIVLLEEPVDDITVSGFELIGDVAGGANAEFGIYFKYGKNLRAIGNVGTDVGAGLVGMHTCDDPVVLNSELNGCVAQGGQSSKGRMFTASSCARVVIDGYKARGYEKYIVFAEFGSDVIARNGISTNDFPGRDNVHTALYFAGENTVVNVDTVTLNGSVSYLSDHGDVNGIVTFSNVTDNTT